MSEYPAKAVNQAIGVLQLHAEVHRFDNLRFWAFWEELWVESRILRRTLSRWMKSILPSLPTNTDHFEQAEKFTFSIPEDQLAGRLNIKSGADAQSGLFALIFGAMGGDPGWDYQPLPVSTREVLDEQGPSDFAQRILRLDDLIQPVGSFGPLVDEAPHPSELLGQIANTGLGNPGWWAKAIREIPIAELKAARDTARVLSKDLVYIADLVGEEGLGTFPKKLIDPLRGPTGRGAAAIRHSVSMIGQGIVLNKLEPVDQVAQNLDAMRIGAQMMREAVATTGT